MRMWIAVAFALGLAVASMPVRALELDGAMTQGGLVVGRTVPGAEVRLDGKQVRVSDDGVFVLGFGRDAPGAAKLVVVVPDGGRDERMLDIEKRKYKISRIDGLPKKHVTPDPEAVKRIRADNAAIGTARKRDSEKTFFADEFSWPVRGRVSGVYGSQRILNGKPRSPHNGVDVAAPTGTVIAAPAAGVVVLAHPDMFYTGQTLMLDHGHGVTSVYAHMSETLVRPGQTVAKGQRIGKVGKTGRATGPHLHWGVTWFSTHLDPALLTGPMREPEKKASR